jgi:hypothetical protein
LVATFDPVYFSPTSWADRVAAWINAESTSFSRGNARVVAEVVSEIDAGLRVVINISAYALLEFLAPGGRFLNLYERPVIGGEARTASAARQQVDHAMAIDPTHTYFAAVALGGVGVRYYGEYCMVLRLDSIDPDPQLFDRDSYDILLEPISLESARFLDRLRGSWDRDAQAMVLMRVLPAIKHDRQLVTAGTISDLVLSDQEFIEVHLQPDQIGGFYGDRSFTADDVEELRESPDEVTAASRMRERESDGLRLTPVEREWMLRRENVTRLLSRRPDLPTRIVTQHGKGYQWK